MKIKEIALMTFITAFIFVSYILNVSIGESGGENLKYTEKSIPLNLKENQINSLSSIRTMFCNNGLEEEKLTRGLSLIMRPGEEKEICIIHFNLGPKDIYLRGAFPENAIEKNGNRNCSDRNNRDDPFAKFIKPFEEASIKVPGKGYAIRKTTIKYPIGMSGMQKGCFAYGQNLDSQLLDGQLFSLLVRKVNYIDVLIDGNKYSITEKAIYKITKNKKTLLTILFFIILFLLIFEIKKIFHKS